jgi:ADP-heptose:LPS heptosyltransferase
MSVRRIAIVNLTRLGDLLQTSPTIAGLRRMHPGASITLVAEKNFAEVCEAIPGVDRVHRLDLDQLGCMLLGGPSRVAEAHHAVRGWVEELRAERFDLALNFSSSRMSAVLLGLLGVPDVGGWSMTRDGHRAIRTPWARLFAATCLNRRVAPFNLVDSYRGVAGCLGTPSGGLSFTIGDRARASVAALLQGNGIEEDARVIALQLGASRDSRQWPIGSFARVAQQLGSDNHAIVLVGGGGERARAEELLQACGPGAARVVDLCGRTSIAELGALLERSRLLVTGDTGPMHMAAATRTPVVGLFFGPALPFDTGPYGEDHVVLHAGVPCAPCDHAVSCLDPFCRRTLAPELVAAVARARLAGDWPALDAVATRAGSGAVRLYRTGFDARGLFECRALGAVAERPEDHLRRAYRATWLAMLEGVPLPPGWPSGLDAGAFDALRDLAGEGRRVAGRLAERADGAAVAFAEIERLGRELETLDRDIAEHGRIRPEVAVLTQMFAFEKETMPGETLAELGRESARLYHQLERSAGSMQALLGGWRAVHEVDHASVRQ